MLDRGSVARRRIRQLSSQVGICPGQLDTRPQRLEDGHSGLGGRGRFTCRGTGATSCGTAAASCRPRAAGHPPPATACSARSAGVGGVLPPVEQRHLVGQPVVQPGSGSRDPARPRTAAPARTAPPPRGARPARPPGGPRRAHGAARGTIACGLGVEGQPGVVVAAGAAQRGQDPGVDGAAAVRRDRLLDCQPGDLVPEPQPAAVAGQQPGGQQLIDGRRRAPGHRFQQPQLDPGAGQRRGVQQLAGIARSAHGPGQHRVAGRSRHRARPDCSTSVT